MSGQKITRLASLDVRRGMTNHFDGVEGGKALFLKRLAAVVILAATTAACTHSEVARTSEREAFISVSGSAFTSNLDVYRRVLLEGAKATLAAGYDFFIIEASADTSRTGTFVIPGQSYTSGQATVVGNSVYGSATTTYTPAQAVPIFKPGQDVRIRFLKASEVYAGMNGARDARWILAHQ